VTGEDMPNELALMVLWNGPDCVIQNRKDGGIGFWGGKIREGEEPLEAAYRETGEEISKKFEKWLRAAGIVRPMGDEIESDGFVIHTFQAPLRDEMIKEATEGEPITMSPMAMWRDERLMVASRAVIKEFILIPNGLIDN
jgi:ADP-ribose pyrophosphatase YjhB (NUDIX family)